MSWSNVMGSSPDTRASFHSSLEYFRMDEDDEAQVLGSSAKEDADHNLIPLCSASEREAQKTSLLAQKILDDTKQAEKLAAKAVRVHNVLSAIQAHAAIRFH
jgi:hypothetical protein